MDNNFQSYSSEHVHYQQQYFNYAYQVMQKNSQLSNNNHHHQIIQQQQQFQATNNNNNVNTIQTQSLSHCNILPPQQYPSDLYTNNKMNTHYRPSHSLQQQNLKPSINLISSLYSTTDSSQAYGPVIDNQNQKLHPQQQQQQQQFIQNNVHSQHHHSMPINPYSTKISHPIQNNNLSASNKYSNYCSNFDIQNQDFLMNDSTNRIPSINCNNMHLEQENVMIRLQNSDFMLKHDKQITPTKRLSTNLINDSDNINFINNFISTSPTLPVADYSGKNSRSTSYLNNSSLNDSGFNSNPSSVESTFSSKQSSISDVSNSFDDQFNEYENSNSSSCNTSIETNIKALSIQETAINSESSPLNVFICWMDSDESQLNDFELEMREILKQQSALNLYILNNNDIYNAACKHSK